MAGARKKKMTHQEYLEMRGAYRRKEKIQVEWRTKQGLKELKAEKAAKRKKASKGR